MASVPGDRERAPGTPGEVTQLLTRLGEGDESAGAELLPLVYRELHSAAERCMRGEAEGHTLQTTALVHEAWVRLMAGSAQPDFESRAHFLRVAARAMRNVLVDHARAKRAQKRGQRGKAVPLDAVVAAFEERSLDVLEVHDALEKLESVDAELANIFELRLFGGLSMEQIAAARERSLATIERRWRVARLWMQRELSGEPT